jgi:hypothetical protein
MSNKKGRHRSVSQAEGVGTASLSPSPEYKQTGGVLFVWREQKLMFVLCM